MKLTRLTQLSYHDIIRRLRKLGFRFYRPGKAPHEVWVRDEDGRVIPVPHYKSKNIRKGTVKAIIREIGIGVDEFFKL